MSSIKTGVGILFGVVIGVILVTVLLVPSMGDATAQSGTTTSPLATPASDGPALTDVMTATATLTATQTAVLNPPTQTPEPTATQPPAQPTDCTTSYLPIASVGGGAPLGCPIAEHLTSSAFADVTMDRPDGWYHLNISVSGAPAGTEANAIVRLEPGISWVRIEYDGSAWFYADEERREWGPDCQICGEIRGDSVLRLPNLEGVLSFFNPCDERAELTGPTEGLLIRRITWKDAEGEHTWDPFATDEVSYEFPEVQPGVVVQGEDVTGEAYGFCALTWWVRGGNGEQVTLFVAREPTQIGPFNGSLSCWPVIPSMADIGTDKVLAAVEAAVAAGISLPDLPFDLP